MIPSNTPIQDFINSTVSGRSFSLDLDESMMESGRSLRLDDSPDIRAAKKYCSTIIDGIEGDKWELGLAERTQAANEINQLSTRIIKQKLNAP